MCIWNIEDSGVIMCFWKSSGYRQHSEPQDSVLLSVATKERVLSWTLDWLRVKEMRGDIKGLLRSSNWGEKSTFLRVAPTQGGSDGVTWERDSGSPGPLLGMELTELYPSPFLFYLGQVLLSCPSWPQTFSVAQSGSLWTSVSEAIGLNHLAEFWQELLGREGWARRD